ncbi:MAG: PhoH family protein [Pseudomonadales bacterium]|nr:PhoH family protein [Pseudomonadales bacterium]MCP5184603.1 PhoH family protein [Pseudomonadales bacterium]
MVPLNTTLSLEPNDSHRLAALCGPYDQNLKHLEKRLNVHIRNRGNRFQISGGERRVRAASALLQQLYLETAENAVIEPDMVHLFLQEAGVDALLADIARDEAGSESGDRDPTVVRTGRKLVKARGGNQAAYVEAVRSHDINFGIGPAGTGKTYLAVACAVEALESHRVSRIILVRPAVEAGEKLGFLPGDLAQKIDPYLRPLYDALYEMMGTERVNKSIERNVIEVAPLAYMRGRTLNNAFIILDESQNTTIEQMKMFLTRIGFGSTAVITGDITQIDLPRGQESGLVNVRQVLRDVEGIHFTHFTSRDVVRHPLVQKVVDAYAAWQVRGDRRDGARDSHKDGQHGT